MFFPAARMNHSSAHAASSSPTPGCYILLPFFFFFYSKVIFFHVRGRLTSLTWWDFNWGRGGRRNEDVDRDVDLKGETRQREDSVFFLSLFAELF